MKHIIKMSRRLAERLLRKKGTNFLMIVDKVLQLDACCVVIDTEETNRSLVDDWEVIAIYYKGAYMPIAEKDD